MKTLFFDCSMGAAGDMIAAALLELLPDPEKFIQKFNALGIHKFKMGNVILKTDRVSRCGIVGTHAKMFLNLSDDSVIVEEHSEYHVHDHHDDEESHEHGHHGIGHEHRHHDDEESHEHAHHDDEESHDHGHHGIGHDHSHHDDEECHAHGHHSADHKHRHHDDEESHEHDHHDDEESHEHRHHDDEESHEHGHHNDEGCHDHGHDSADHKHGHHDHAHIHGMKMSDIRGILDSLEISEFVRHHCIEIFDLIASAESHVHGCSVEQVHFHEVGQLDALGDILASCMLMEELAPVRIVASPICTGKGMVRCAHGVLPVPAPATAYILCGIPCFQGKIESEMCTPTGAAVLVHFVDEFSEMPVMIPEKIGYGMGSRVFADTANALRVILGTQENAENEMMDMVEIHANVDDMTGEQIGFAVNKLIENGANDVWTMPIVMKKGRPAQTLACLVPAFQSEKFAQLVLRYTSSFGVRIFSCSRISLSRTVKEVHTDYGVIRKKCSLDSIIRKSKWEYDDLSEAASRLNMTIYELTEKLNSFN